MLPLYQCPQQKIHKDGRLKTNGIGCQLTLKDTNRNSCKSKSNEPTKKVSGSANSSIDVPKNLSRAKSKSNLIPLKFETQAKRSSVQALDKPEKPQ
jgi:hypothetical protein